MKVAVVVLDTLRKDAISPYDGAIDHTPNLAAFADEATVYDNAITQAPWSLPSQASLLTGRYPWQHGAGQNQPYLEPDEPRLQDALGRAGHYTAAIHENTWLAPATGMMAGFDEYAMPTHRTRAVCRLWRRLHDVPMGPTLARKLVLALSGHQQRSAIGERTDSTWFLERTRRFLDAHAEEDFFLYLNPVNAHYPYEPPQAYADAHGVQSTCCDLDSRPIEYGGGWVPTETEDLRRLYAAEVDYLDDVFGRMRELFVAHGIEEETMFVVLSDHGELLGEDDVVGHHFSVRPELTDVPLMIRRPGGGGGRETAVTELRELFAIILRAAGVSAPGGEPLFEDRGAGMYETPSIYGARLPPERSDLAVPRFYHVGERDRETSVDVGRSIATASRETIGLDSTGGAPRPVPDLD
jgi:choline-sulfatase